MAKFGFYNSNEFRSYPLTPDVPAQMQRGPGDLVDLPESFLVDFGCVMGPLAEYDEDDAIYLEKIARDGSTILITFKATSPGVEDHELTFTRSISDADYTAEETESLIGGSSSQAEGCREQFRWEGFLVTGRMQPLVDLLSDGQSLTAVDQSMTIEPGTVQNLARRCVMSVNLANAPRTVAGLPSGCEGSLPYEEEPYNVSATCLRGDLKFKEGYNSSIVQNPNTNSFTFSAQVGAGAGVSCNEFPWYEGEEPTGAGSLYSGGPGCGDVITNINTIAGPSVPLLAGLGISINLSEGDPHKIEIQFDLNGLAVCIPDRIISSLSLGGN